MLSSGFGIFRINQSRFGQVFGRATAALGDLDALSQALTGEGTLPIPVPYTSSNVSFSVASVPEHFMLTAIN